MEVLFEVDGEFVQPTANCYVLEPLKNVLDKFKDDQQVQMDAIAYIFFRSCPNSLNPFNQVLPDEREQIIRDSLKTKIDFEMDDDVGDAIDFCSNLYMTPVARMYKSVLRLVEKLSIFIENEAFSSGKDGNVSQLINAGIKLKDLKSVVSEIKSEMDAELSGGGRGGEEIPYDQR